MFQKDKIQRAYFTVFFLSILGLTAYLFLPFATVLILSLVAAILLQSYQKKMIRYFKSNVLASALSIVLLAVCVFLPIIFLANIFIMEAQSVYASLTSAQGGNGGLAALSEMINNVLVRIDPESNINLGASIAVGINWFIKNVGGILISGTATLFLQFFIFFVTTFFLLKDGKAFAEFAHDLSPLDEQYDRKIFSSIVRAVQSIIKGVFVIAIIQGTLTGIGLWIFGLPNPLFWGAVAALCAPIPLVGTGAVLVPAVIYLAITSSPISAILLILWGLVLVGFIDNLLAPYIYSQGIEVHQLPMLLSVLGGLSVFGVMGFIIGPLVLAVCISLIEIYKELVLIERV